MILAQATPDSGGEPVQDNIDAGIDATKEAAENNGVNLNMESATDPETYMHLFETYGLPAIKVLVILIVAYLVASWAGGMVTRTCNKGSLDLTLSRFFGKMTKWAILIMALLSVLSVFGINTTSFAAVIGAAGLAIALSFQGTLGHFASGIMLLVFRPFTVGDVVDVAGVVGKVYEIDLFNTRLDTPDNQRVIVPNGAVFGSTITNITHHDTRRVDVAVGTDYPADLDQARSVLLEAARKVEGVLTDPAPAAVLCDLGDSSINWSVRVWSTTDDYWAVKDALTRAVKVALDDANIGIPFPQMDVHVDGKLAS